MTQRPYISLYFDYLLQTVLLKSHVNLSYLPYIRSFTSMGFCQLLKFLWGLTFFIHIVPIFICFVNCFSLFCSLSSLGIVLTFHWLLITLCILKNVNYHVAGVFLRFFHLFQPIRLLSCGVNFYVFTYLQHV